MISECQRIGCKNNFQHPRVVEKHYCSKYCRFVAAGSRNRKRSRKLDRLRPTYHDACKRSESLKVKFKKENE